MRIINSVLMMNLATTGRKLASVRLIDSLKPIPDADKIEVATVGGWKAVVRKGEFQEGEKIVYCEIDSLLPVREEFEHLRKSCYIRQDGTEGFRLRTIRLRGQTSQGLIVSLSTLENPEQWEIGDDVTTAMGIEKYEPYETAPPKGLEPFPAFIRKTDEERIQNLSDQLPALHGQTFHVTEKLDGTSFTAYWHEGEFGVCQRNFRQALDSNTPYIRMAKNLRLKEKLENMGRSLAVQGELVGPGIQGNVYKLDVLRLCVFNIFDIKSGEYLPKREVMELAKELELDTVPVIEEAIALPDSIDDILELAEGKSALNKKKQREGLVFVCNELVDGERVSFKAISNKFLMKNEDK